MASCFSLKSASAFEISLLWRSWLLQHICSFFAILRYINVLNNPNNNNNSSNNNNNYNYNNYKGEHTGGQWKREKFSTTLSSFIRERTVEDLTRRRRVVCRWGSPEERRPSGSRCRHLPSPTNAALPPSYPPSAPEARNRLRLTHTSFMAGQPWPFMAHRDLDFLRHINTLTYLLMGTFKPQSNGPLYSNIVIGTLAVDGWAVTFGAARRGLLRHSYSPTDAPPWRNILCFQIQNMWKYIPVGILP